MLPTALLIFGLLLSAPALAGNAAIELHAPGKATIRVDESLLAGMPRAKATAGPHGTASSEWEGVALTDLLQRLDAPQGDALRGTALALLVRVTGADGYQAVFSLAELDADFGKVVVLIADRQNGKPLPAETGPFRLVVPADHRAARWVRQVRKIELVSARDDTQAPASKGEGGKH